MLKGKYGLSVAYSCPCELSGRGGGVFFYRLWKVSGKGGDKWCSSLGPKQAAVFNHQTHTLEARQVYMHPDAKTHITHTHISIFCGFCSQAVVYFLRWMLLSLRFVLQSLNEGQYVRKREFTQTHCSAAQRNIKEPVSLSHPR